MSCQNRFTSLPISPPMIWSSDRKVGWVCQPGARHRQSSLRVARLELRRGYKPSGVSFAQDDPLRLRRHTLFRRSATLRVTQSRPEPEAASGWLTRQHIAALRLDLETWVGAALSTLLDPIAR